jgi:predicted nucleic acid-binding protein
MTEPILLDSGPLGRLAHPRPSAQILGWLHRSLAAGITIILPEIADYEVRRSFLLAELHESVERLNELKQSLIYLPLNTQAILDAASLWAEARRQGQPTADRRELDADVILAAQARQVGGVVATENVGHLARFVEARSWREFPR